MSCLADALKGLENERLRALVQADAGVLDRLHAADFILQCWHMDCYRRAGADSPWQVGWSQATECG